MNTKPIVAVTAGDVSGIGPEVIVRALTDPHVKNACRPFVLCSTDVLRKAADICGVTAAELEFVACNSLPNTRAEAEDFWKSTSEAAVVHFDPQPNVAAPSLDGTVNSTAGDAAYRYLLCAINLAKTGVVDAITTAPLNKAALQAAGHHFPGHTEILADQCGVDDFAMMLHLSETQIAPYRKLISGNSTTNFEPKSGLSIAHVTLHTSVESVPGLLSSDNVLEKIGLMNQFLKQVGSDRSAIAVCALNPHGGEQGLFGNEEREVIQPAVQSAAEAGINVVGPLPVDTLIRRAVIGEFDGIVAMYHDQGHIPIKLIGFDSAVNITLGLPIVRTSPTHGTAFDRAWNADTPADESGMKEAILAAVKLYNGASG